MTKVGSIIGRIAQSDDDFDFGGEGEVTASSGNPEEQKDKPIPFRELQKIARGLAESPEGLDIAVFQEKYKIPVVNVESLLGE